MAFKEFKSLWIKSKPWNNAMYRYDELRKVIGLSMTETGRMCVKVEFKDGEIDYVAMLTEDREWMYCDEFGKEIKRKE